MSERIRIVLAGLATIAFGVVGMLGYASPVIEPYGRVMEPAAMIGFAVTVWVWAIRAPPGPTAP